MFVSLLSSLLPGRYHRHIPVLAQFIKYVLCGLAAAGLLSATMAAFALIWPELLNSRVNTDPHSRAAWFAAFTWFAFLPINSLVWWVNRKVVFTPGKHHPVTEFILFTAISASSQGIGLLLPDFLIREFNLPSSFALGVLITVSTLVNFVLRKWLVFRKTPSPTRLAEAAGTTRPPTHAPRTKAIQK